MNAHELELFGDLMAGAGRGDLLRSVGTRIWAGWHQEILSERHPKRSFLIAFLRFWSAPAGDWIPKGMADYLADRLDPTVSTPDRGGAPPPSDGEVSERDLKELQISVDAHNNTN